MKKILIYTVIFAIVSVTIYFLFLYYASYSQGYRAGELIKITRKGYVFKTWEGELSQGVSEAQLFRFSVTDDEIIEKLKNLQGQQVKLTYKERFKTMPWWGDTEYFIIDVEKTKKHQNNTNQNNTNQNNTNQNNTVQEE